MTSIAPTPEGTTGSLPITAPTQGRRRDTTAAPYGPPSWLPLTLTGTAAIVFLFAIYLFRHYPTEPATPLLMIVAGLYLTVAFGVDLHAAITARSTTLDADIAALLDEEEV